MIIKNRRVAFSKFKEQWLVGGTGGGDKHYRTLLRTKGLEFIIEQWKLFVDNQYRNEYISGSQHNAWQTSYPIQIQWLISTRKYRGNPTGLPRGNPNFKKKVK